jgi:competence protein ComEA
MKMLHDLAAKLSITRTELMVISLLLFFLLLGALVKYSGSVRQADELIRAVEADRYSEAEVDSLLRSASHLDKTVEEEIAREAPDSEAGPRQTSGGLNGRHQKKTFTGTIAFNTASEKQLRMLPGIGPVMAQKLVSFRKAKGGKIKQFDDFLEVRGIGRKKLDLLKKHLTLE